MQVRNKT